MDTQTIAIGAVILIVAVLLYVLRQLQQVRTEMLQQNSRLQEVVSQRLDTNTGTMSNHLGTITSQITNTSNVVAQVEGKLGQMQEASRQIYDLARQISSLKDILQSPKMRGNLGETLLSNLLEQSLHTRHFRLQYSFKTGVIVDAAVFLSGKILCIDSKFPLENFRRIQQTESDVDRKKLTTAFHNDVKKHVHSIAEKYIVPDENTFDFALMFIPAENVYYELIIRDEGGIQEHVEASRVIPVSPNTFYAFLQVITMGLRGFHIEEKAKQILAQLQQIQVELTRYETGFAKIGAHLQNAQTSYSKSDVGLQRLKKKMVDLGEAEDEEEPEAIPAATPDHDD